MMSFFKRKWSDGEKWAMGILSGLIIAIAVWAIIPTSKENESATPRMNNGKMSEQPEQAEKESQGDTVAGVEKPIVKAWSRDLNGAITDVSMGGTSVVVVGDSHGTVSVLDRSTGNLLWNSKPVSKRGLVTIAVADDLIYCHIISWGEWGEVFSALIAIDLASGKPLWNKDLKPLTSKEDLFLAGSDRNQVILSGHKGSILAFGAKSGEKLWRASINTGGNTPGLLLGGVFIHVNTTHIATALNAKTGEILWEKKWPGGMDGNRLVSTLSTPSGTNGEAFFLYRKQENQRIVSLKTLTGKVLANAQVSSKKNIYFHKNYMFTSPPLLVRNSVYFGVTHDDGSGFNVYAVTFDSLGTARLKWKYLLGKRPNSQTIEIYPRLDNKPLNVGGLIIGATLDGTIVALDPAHGEETWRSKVGRSPRFDASENIFIGGGDDGVLYAFSKQ